MSGMCVCVEWSGVEWSEGGGVVWTQQGDVLHSTAGDVVHRRKEHFTPPQTHIIVYYHYSCYLYGFYKLDTCTFRLS